MIYTIWKMTIYLQLCMEWMWKLFPVFPRKVRLWEWTTHSRIQKVTMPRDIPRRFSYNFLQLFMCLSTFCLLEKCLLQPSHTSALLSSPSSCSVDDDNLLQNVCQHILFIRNQLLATFTLVCVAFFFFMYTFHMSPQDVTSF